MTDSYYAGSYWLARPETAEACARRAEAFFHHLGLCDPAWNHWQDTAAPEKSLQFDFRPNTAAFARMFAREENQQGPDGFRFSLWGGETVAEATAVNVRCGSATPWLSSMCVLDFPTCGAVAARTLTVPVMSAVVRAMALAWEPEWAVVTSHEHRQKVSERAKAGTFVGGVMYFSRVRGAVPLLPAPVRVEPVEDKGTLVILTPETFVASNAEHVALAVHVQRLLDAAGLLRPLQPLVSR